MYITLHGNSNLDNFKSEIPNSWEKFEKATIQTLKYV